MVSEGITCHVAPDGTAVEISPIPRKAADIEQIREAIGYLTVGDPVVNVNRDQGFARVDLASDITPQAVRAVLSSVGCQVI